MRKKLTPWVPTPAPDPFATDMFTFFNSPRFNPTYEAAAGWAKEILLAANLPEDIELVEAQGFREGNDIEWYAAAIIRHWNFIEMTYCGHPRGSMKSLAKELDRLIREAEVLVNPSSLKAQNAGNARGKQETEARAPVWAELQKAAERYWKKNEHLSAHAVAQKIKDEIYRKEGRTIGIRTITNRIRKPA